MELCQSDLRKWMDNNAKRDKDVISNFFIQILEGVKYLHEITNHMHRDLKPSTDAVKDAIYSLYYHTTANHS